MTIDRNSPLGIAVLNLLKGNEGIILHAYKDQVGKLTIGIGSTMWKDGTPIKPGEACSLDVAEDLCLWEAGNKLGVIKSLLGNVALNDNQLLALLDFTYNEGIGALQQSSLLRTIKANPLNKNSLSVNSVTDQSVKDWMVKNNWQSVNVITYYFMVYNKITIDGKKVFNEGLIKRRIREAQLYWGEVN